MSIHSLNMIENTVFLNSYIYSNEMLFFTIILIHLIEKLKLHNILTYVLLSMCNVSYHFEDNRVLHDILKRLYTFPRWTVSKV